MDKDHKFPSDIRAETSLLGGLLLDNEQIFEDADELTSDDFYLSSHQTIFRVIVSLLLGEVQEAVHADIITISAELERQKLLSSIGGVAYLATLTEGLPRRPNLGEYVAIIKEKAKLRKLAKIGNGLYLNALENFDAATLLDQVEAQLVEVEAEEKDGAVRVGDLTGAINERILKMRDKSFDKVELEMTWGIEDLDRKTKGAFGGEITVVGGDSGGGKTQFVVQMAVENALKGVPVHIFSMEMEKEKFVQRMYPLMSSVITAGLMRDPRGMTLHTHVPELKKIEKLIKSLPIYIDDTSPMTDRRLIAKMKKSIRQHDTKLFIGDYLQLISVPGQKDLQEIKTVMFTCRDFFKLKENETRHLVMLSQYAKEQGFMKKKRRTKGDLHGGAVIHQAAQNVLLITVESPDKKEPGSNLDTEIMIDKARDGQPGKVYCQRDALSLRYIPAAPPTEKKADEQPKGNAKQRSKSKPTSGGAEETGSGYLREDQG